MSQPVVFPKLPKRKQGFSLMVVEISKLQCAGLNRLEAEDESSLRERILGVPTVADRVAQMVRPGAHCLVGAEKRGNARGAKGAGHLRQDRVNG